MASRNRTTVYGRICKAWGKPGLEGIFKDIQIQAKPKMTSLIRLVNKWLVPGSLPKMHITQRRTFILSPSAEKKADSTESCTGSCLQGKHADPPTAPLMSERHLTQPSTVCVGYSEVICKKLLALLKNIYEKARLSPRAQSSWHGSCHSNLRAGRQEVAFQPKYRLWVIWGLFIDWWGLP